MFRSATSLIRLRLNSQPPFRKQGWLSICAAVSGLLLSCGVSAHASGDEAAKRSATRFAGIPLSFEANQGQTDPQVKFISRGDGYSLFLTSNTAVLKLRTPAGPDAAPSVLRMELLGAAPEAQIAGSDQLPGVTNYFIGSDPKRWHPNVATFGRVKYQGIYPGVDAVFYGNQRQLEYDFVVAPNADPGPIALGLSGVAPVLDADGNVVLKTAGGDLLLCKPVVYQGAADNKNIVAASYVLSGNQVRFKLGKYDHTQPLVIDPKFDYMTYLGGSGNDSVGSLAASYVGYNPLSNALAIDSTGNTYVTGMTYSDDFPTLDGYEDTWTGYNSRNYTAFVSKINPAGTALVYSTYLGGSTTSDGDLATAIAVDASGDAYVVGQTISPDFPITTGAYQTTPSASGYSAFVTKLNPAGNGLVYSSFLAGSGTTAAYGIALDAKDQAYVTGSTSCNCTPPSSGTPFPVTSNALVSTENNFAYSGFITVFNAAGTSLVYSSLLGDDQALQYYTSTNGVAVDPSGNFYVTGITQSPNLPVTAGAFQTALGTASGQSANQTVAFAAKFGPVSGTGNLLTYLTYLRATGTDYFDWGAAITADSAGNAYVAGFTGSPTFPATAGAYETSCPTDASYCAFVTKLNPSGTALVWSTLLGGNGSGNTGVGDVDQYVSSIALDVLGNVYVGGQAQSGFPSVNSVQPNLDTDASGFITKIDPTGSTLLFSSMLGDPATTTWVGGAAVDSLGNIYVGGGVWDGTGIPVTTGVLQPTFGGGQYDGWVAKIHIEAPDLTIASSHTGNFTLGENSAGYTLTVNNIGDGPTSGTVTVTEAVPTGLTLESMSGSGWTCTTLPTCTRSDVLAVSGSYPSIAVSVDVAMNAPSSVTNMATVSGGSEYNFSNDSASDLTTINNPAPVTTSISSTTVEVGGAGFTLTVNGNGFVPTSTVNWNGAALTTTYVSWTELQAAVPSSDLAAIGTAQITVTSPAPGGGTSTPSLPLAIEPAASSITSPSAGTLLPGPAVTFTWTAAYNASYYELYIGSTGVGSSNVYSSGSKTVTSLAVTGLPTNGETLYVRLLTNFSGTWKYADYTYTAVTHAVLTTPAPGGTFGGPNVTFSWTAATGTQVSGYRLYLGSTGVGSNNLYSSALQTGTTFSAIALPTNGETIYARLITSFNGTLASADYTYTADTHAELTSPTPGGLLPGKTVTFTWSAAVGGTYYELWLGSTGPGSYNLYDSLRQTVKTITVGGLPSNGETIYARVLTDFNGSWAYADYTYTAVTAPVISSPAQGSLLPGPNVTFTWSGAVGESAYELYIGSTGVGSNNLYSSGSKTVSTLAVSSLPTNGETLYVRLLTNFNGSWAYSDYTYTAATHAVLATPAAGSTLGAAPVTFTLTPATGTEATAYELWLGSTGAGSSDLYSSGQTTATTFTVKTLPTNGETIYARVLTNFSGTWGYVDYTLKAQ